MKFYSLLFCFLFTGNCYLKAQSIQVTAVNERDAHVELSFPVLDIGGNNNLSEKANLLLQNHIMGAFLRTNYLSPFAEIRYKEKVKPGFTNLKYESYKYSKQFTSFQFTMRSKDENGIMWSGYKHVQIDHKTGEIIPFEQVFDSMKFRIFSIELMSDFNKEIDRQAFELGLKPTELQNLRDEVSNYLDVAKRCGYFLKDTFVCFVGDEEVSMQSQRFGVKVQVLKPLNSIKQLLTPYGMHLFFGKKYSYPSPAPFRNYYIGEMQDKQKIALIFDGKVEDKTAGKLLYFPNMGYTDARADWNGERLSVRLFVSAEVEASSFLVLKPSGNKMKGHFFNYNATTQKEVELE